jgi:chromate transporter
VTLLTNCFYLFLSFFKIGITGFGGGYAMMSMMMIECEKYSISTAQFADLNALDMIIPGPIAINAATYVGYLHSGFWGALAATVGVMLPSFFIVTLVMYFIWKYRESMVLTGAISGIKPAAVGLIAAAALIIASDVLTMPGADIAGIFGDPIGTVSFFMVAVFLATAVANLRFKVNPILLTVLAGILGAVFTGVIGGEI